MYVSLQYLENYVVLLNYPENYDFKMKPNTFIFWQGLYLEGAKWDHNKMVVGESAPKILFDLMPLVSFFISCNMVLKCIVVTQSILLHNVILIHCLYQIQLSKQNGHIWSHSLKKKTIYSKNLILFHKPWHFLKLLIMLHISVSMLFNFVM